MVNDARSYNNIHIIDDAIGSGATINETAKKIREKKIASKCYDFFMKNKKPIVYVICGFIGAGKTTFARKLEHETKAIRITKDEWIIKIFVNNLSEVYNR